ncbi:RCC1 domain-containing protein [Polyangium mundeleinium]|uniref:Chromosome condensation regulator RCC1 n=1 Tax=Polyangium mundeleinium TaxID=2995306 RepID=A0ABT5EYW2_9BACT|nr:hypothetical protein [Polyangium mundeleinium]MDC0746006.1 hypothetical protein [Polyangium mundeleinium]
MSCLSLLVSSCGTPVPTTPPAHVEATTALSSPSVLPSAAPSPPRPGFAVARSRLVAGDHITCLLRDGEVFCWGRGEDGVPGQGNKLDLGDVPGALSRAVPIDLGRRKGARERATVLGAGPRHACAALAPLPGERTARLACWGYAHALGLADNRGDSPGELGDAWPKIDMGEGTILSVAAGVKYTCALLEDGATREVRCFGEIPGGKERFVPVQAVDFGTKARPFAMAAGNLSLSVAFEDGHVRSLGVVGKEVLNAPNVHVGTELLVPLPGRTIALVGGASGACARGEDGALRCWDFVDGGGLGHRHCPDVSAPISLGKGLRAVSMATSGSRFCAIVEGDGPAPRVKCWGINQWGALGGGDDLDRCMSESLGDALPFVDLGTNSPVEEITVGASHTCALFGGADAGRVKCWGAGLFGELGTGDKNRSYGRTPDTMGIHLPFVSLPH